MTVEELITKLSKYNPKATVKLSIDYEDDDCGTTIDQGIQYVSKGFNDEFASDKNAGIPVRRIEPSREA